MFGQLKTSAEIPSLLVQQYFEGNGVTISNITFTGNSTSIGRFIGINSNIGIDSGIVLTTGLIGDSLFLGQSAINQATYYFFSPGDSDLDSLNSISSRDATVLEFDFTAVGDSIKFDYVFASEEYPSNVCNLFNDAFAFFISGPGVSAMQNIALVPYSSDIVSINSINGGTAIWPASQCASLSNTQYYVDNTNGTSVIFNGFTTVLTATAGIIPCQTYHLKIVIADGYGGNVDSGVFLKANSFNSEPISITPSVSYGGPDTLLYEGCGYAELVIRRTYNLQQPKTYTINYSGTAIEGLDYTTTAQQITMQAGQMFDTIQIVPLADFTADDGETLIVSIGDTLCNGDYFVSEVTMIIHEKQGLMINLVPSAGNFCDTVLFVPEITGAIQPVQYDWNNGASSDTVFFFFSSGTQTIILEVSDACGQTAQQSVVASFGFYPVADFSHSPDYCDLLNAPVYFQDRSSADVTQWLWNFGYGEGSSTLQNPVYFYTEPDSHTVSLVVETAIGCADTVSKPIVIHDIPTLYIPNSFTPNSDGLNDVFEVRGNEIASFEMVVLDRWGNELYRTQDMQQGWNGHYQGTACEMGVYAVRVDYTLVNAPEIIHSRYERISLIR